MRFGKYAEKSVLRKLSNSEILYFTNLKEDITYAYQGEHSRHLEYLTIELCRTSLTGNITGIPSSMVNNITPRDLGTPYIVQATFALIWRSVVR